MAGISCHPSVKIRSVHFCLKQAGLQACGKKIGNHSVRKTSISRLLDGGTPENFVAQLSGHKNMQSLSWWKSASITHQRKMSDILQQQASRPGLSPNVPDFVSVNGTSSQQSSFSQQRSFSFSFQAMPPASFSLRISKYRVNFQLFLILFNLNRGIHLAAAYMETPQNTKNCTIPSVENFPHVVFVHTDKMNSFIWRWHWTKFALSTFCLSYSGIWKYSRRQREVLSERFITIRYRKSL